jgi:hypothetical protein
MKNRIKSDIKSRLIRSTSYMLLLWLAVGVIPLALAQRSTTKTKRRVPALPANIVVTNTNDSGPGSLRNALAVANDGDEITFAVTGTITLTSGQLTVNSDITISGPGAGSLAVDGNAKTGVFFINSGVTVTISGLSITNGNAFSLGGGIYNGSATVVLSNCIVSGNSAQYGGGIYNEGVFGSATLTIINSTINGNTVSAEGGGIYAIAVIAPVTVTINNSTISSNSAFLGGGIRNVSAGVGANLIISNSSISGNSAGPDNGGGGVSNQGGNAISEINNSTFSGNSAGDDGGSIHNAAATVELSDTILKAGTLGGNILNQSGTITSNGYNLSDDDAGGYLTGPGDQINTDPLLGPLQDNGGPTLTHALLPGSPAKDAGDPNFTPPPLFDQRGLGFDRVVNGCIDIGSLEVQVGGTPTPTPTATPGTMQLRGQKKKVNGMNTVRLNWKGATSASIDVYRNDVLIATTPNAPPFLYTDFTGDTGRAQYTYRVCEAGTTTCSNDLRVRFQE